MTQKKKEYPNCFGKLDMVFPLGKDGLRHTPESCMVCFCKTECLREAVNGPEGIQVHEERVEREKKRLPVKNKMVKRRKNRT
jgi:hypothetical protein